MRVLRRMINKLKSKKGETLTETLGSLLIVVPAMVMLAAALVTAANINHESRDAKTANLPDYSASSGVGASLTASGDVTFTGSFTVYKDDSSVYYYFK